MFRVYSDKFYSDLHIQKDFEEKYVAKIIEVAKNIELKESKRKKKKSSNYELTNKAIKELFDEFHSVIPEFPQTFEELLKLSPKNISSVYVKYKNDNTLQEKVDKALKNVVGPKNGPRELLNYSDDFSSTIIDYFILSEHEDVYTIKTCFYCNHAYINTFSYPQKDEEPLNEEETKKKQQFDLDHFIPKGSCPLFSLCLYNFVPSCQVCNSRIKLKNEYYDGKTAEEIEKLFPTSKEYNYTDSLRFHIRHIKEDPRFDPSDPKYVKNKDDFDIELETIGDNIYLDEADAFKIIPRYRKHIVEFLTYIDKARKYPKSYFLLLAGQKSQKEADSLQEAIFNHRLRNDEKQIFQKIYNDIDKNLENEE